MTCRIFLTIHSCYSSILYDLIYIVEFFFFVENTLIQLKAYLF